MVWLLICETGRELSLSEDLGYAHFVLGTSLCAGRSLTARLVVLQSHAPSVTSVLFQITIQELENAVHVGVCLEQGIAMTGILHDIEFKAVRAAGFLQLLD